MTNAEIASVLDQIADLLEFDGAKAFRIRAYRNGARTIHDLGESVEEMLANPERHLTDLKGVGKDLAEKVTVLVQTGSIPLLEELLEKIPQTVLDILRVPGLGPKRAAILYNQLAITTLDELEKACHEQRVRGLKGFGKKTEESILKGLQIAAGAKERIYWAEADPIVRSILSHLRVSKMLERIEAAGSYRRGKDTVGDLDFLVVASEAAGVMDRLAEYPDVAEVLLRGETKMSVQLQNGLQIDLRVVPAESFGAALQYFTGSKEHNVALRSRAKSRGLKINEYGVFRGEDQVAGRDEEEVYATLDLPCFPPELREGREEFDWAARGALPELVRLEDIRGDLHTHSTWTDGRATIEEMAGAAKWMGLQYLAVTDHSKRVAMVGGLQADEFRAQWAAIDELNNKQRGFKILKGVEVDILEAGGLDLDDDVLAEADWVVASVHFGQNQPREQITRRVVEALENPYVHAIGHPTGRLLNQRSAYEIDLEAMLESARANGKFLELNSNPTRLDLDDLACAAAKKHGVPVVISTDAHGIEGLDAMRYGVLQARRGGLTADDVVNTRSWKEIQRMLGR